MPKDTWKPEVRLQTALESVLERLPPGERAQAGQLFAAGLPLRTLPPEVLAALAGVLEAHEREAP
jgi:hypothetical protein